MVDYMEDIILFILIAVIASAPASIVAAATALRKRTINEVALENAQVAALINQTNMASSVNANMMDAQADKVQVA